MLDFVKKEKNIKFDVLHKVLDITDPFEFDTIVFEAMGLGLITGKIDQKNRTLKVNYFILKTKFINIVFRF